MEIKISPSIMCCKVEEYKPYIELFEKVKLDSIHFDIMDGHYVKNVMLGTTAYKDIKRLSNLPVDLHFMAYNPEEYIEYYNVKSGDRISFHPETTAQPYRLLQSIKEKGCLAGLVINPGTPISFIEESIDLIDYVTLMTVNPGFSGQKMVPNAPEKIRRIVELVNVRNIDVFVDGNTTFENSVIMRKAGANGFVVGTSSIIKSLDTFEANYHKYIKNIENVEI